MPWDDWKRGLYPASPLGDAEDGDIPQPSASGVSLPGTQKNTLVDQPTAARTRRPASTLTLGLEKEAQDG